MPALLGALELALLVSWSARPHGLSLSGHTAGRPCVFAVQDVHFTYAASPTVGWWAPNDIQAHIEPTKSAGNVLSLTVENGCAGLQVIQLRIRAFVQVLTPWTRG
jgi:hypothetical protein